MTTEPADPFEDFRRKQEEKRKREFATPDKPRDASRVSDYFVMPPPTSPPPARAVAPAPAPAAAPAPVAASSGAAPVSRIAWERLLALLVDRGVLTRDELEALKRG